MGPSDLTAMVEEGLRQADEQRDVELGAFVTLRFTGSFTNSDTFELVVDGYPVPYVSVGHLRGATEFYLSLDRRFGLDVELGQLIDWGWFLANAMAISAGRTSHGENSNIRNAHGAPGSGTTTPMVKGAPMQEIPVEV